MVTSIMTINVLAWPKEKNRHQNPYNFLLYQAMGEECRVSEFDGRKFRIDGADILHMHWPKPLQDQRRWRMRWRCGRLLLAFDRLHAQGRKLVWTIHNLHPHKSMHSDLVEGFMQKLVAKTDGLIFHSADNRDEFLLAYPEAEKIPATVIPHMHYGNLYDIEDREQARRRWSIGKEEWVLGVFGKIRPHKGVETLVRLMEQVLKQQSGKSWRLFLADSPGETSISKELKYHLDSEPSTIHLLRHIEEQEISSLFASFDVVILPYEQILNSGTALLALSLGRPIVAPEIGSLPDLRNRFSNWVYLYPPPLTVEKLKQALEWVKARNRPDEKPDLSALEPAAVARATEHFYRTVLQR
ncbi:MAG: glycosyltransferase family 4 protein [Exilibacterium sp.]